jgi:glycosyltransferase involved in cell wall biosynthesis
MDPKPDITAIVPVFNGERYLAQALASITAQTLPPREIIVVDDGSTDGSAAAASSFGHGVVCVRQAHAGAAAARNRGALIAKGDWLAFLDADDLWCPDKLRSQSDALAGNPDLEMAFGHVEQFLCPSLDDETRRRLSCPGEPLPGYHAGTLLIGRPAFTATGGFDEALASGEFLDWYARASEAGLRSVMLPEVVMRRRLHGANQGIYGRADYAPSYLRVLRAAIQRRRGESGRD